MKRHTLAVMAACGVIAVAFVVGTQAGASPRIPGPPAGIGVVYKVPSATGPDGEIFFTHLRNDGTPAGSPQALGRFTTGRAVETHGAGLAPGRAVVLVGATTKPQWRFLDADRSQPARGSGLNATAFADDGTAYEADGSTVVAHRPSGQTQAFAMPAPPAGDLTRDGAPRKGPAIVTARVGALASIQNHAYALIDNSANTVLVELSGGRHVDLPGYGHALGLAIGGDGRAYALLFDPRLSRNPYVVAQVDLGAMRVLGAVSTGIHPSAGDIDDRADIVADGSGRVWVYASQSSPSDPSTHASRLVRVETTTLTTTAMPLAANLGSRVTTGSDDGLYLYSGPGRNVVSRFDPNSNAVRKVAEAPATSFVLALYVR
jgi:hypothetical protein